MMSYHFLVRVSDLSDVTSFLNKERMVNTFDMFMCKAICSFVRHFDILIQIPRPCDKKKVLFYYDHTTDLDLGQFSMPSKFESLHDVKQPVNINSCECGCDEQHNPGLIQITELVFLKPSLCFCLNFLCQTTSLSSCGEAYLWMEWTKQR